MQIECCVFLEVFLLFLSSCVIELVHVVYLVIAIEEVILYEIGGG